MIEGILMQAVQRDEVDEVELHEPHTVQEARVRIWHAGTAHALV